MVALKLEPLIQIPTAWSGITGRFGVHLFEGYVSIADMDRLESNGDRWLKKNPGKLVELVVIFPSNARMSDEERRRMARLIQRWESCRVASATVILAAGILGAMHRSVLTGMLFFAPPPHPSKVFSTVRESVTWLLPHVRNVCGEPIGGEELLKAIDDHCAAFLARPEAPVRG